MNSDHYTDTLRSLKDCLHRVHPTRKVFEVLLLHDNDRKHTSVCTLATTTNPGWTVLPHLSYSFDLTPLDYHLFGHKEPVRTALRL